jgi:hypothetical protein
MILFLLHALDHLHLHLFDLYPGLQVRFLAPRAPDRDRDQDHPRLACFAIQIVKIPVTILLQLVLRDGMKRIRGSIQTMQHGSKINGELRKSGNRAREGGYQRYPGITSNDMCEYGVSPWNCYLPLLLFHSGWMTMSRMRKRRI